MRRVRFRYSFCSTNFLIGSLTRSPDFPCKYNIYAVFLLYIRDTYYICLILSDRIKISPKRDRKNFSVDKKNVFRLTFYGEFDFAIRFARLIFYFNVLAPPEKKKRERATRSLAFLRLAFFQKSFFFHKLPIMIQETN